MSSLFTLKSLVLFLSCILSLGWCDCSVKCRILTFLYWFFFVLQMWYLALFCFCDMKKAELITRYTDIVQALAYVCVWANFVQCPLVVCSAWSKYCICYNILYKRVVLLRHLFLYFTFFYYDFWYYDFPTFHIQ